MLVIVDKTLGELNQRAARIVAGHVRKKPEIVLGLATGKTPQGLYSELIRLCREDCLDFSRVTTFNLDEYYGIPRDDPQSFYTAIHQGFLDHINIKPENTHLPDGHTADFATSCIEYEEAILVAGGIDLQILGIGRTGHIGFNEPTSSLASRTRLKTLSEETIRDNSKDGSEIPPLSITMGIGTILEATELLLLATGDAKSDAIAKAIEGPITSSVSASALQMHGNVRVLLDEAAAAGLRHRNYYDRVVEQTAKYSPERLGL